MKTGDKYILLEKMSPLQKEALEDPEKFWGEQAKCLDWEKTWSKVLDWDYPNAEWFVGGKLNACYNCVDRHIKGNRRNKAAIIWEGEDGSCEVLTYYELYRQVNMFANVLQNLGVEKGDVVAIYMPMMTEAVVAMLACARIGAIHNTVFSGFSSEALSERINNSKAKVLVSTNTLYRRGKKIDLKGIVDKSALNCNSLNNVIYVPRGDEDIKLSFGRDYLWDELMAGARSRVEPEIMDSNDPLFILYTSGTTGSPKGVVHATGGYLTYATKTMDWTWGIEDTDVFWCTADIGWITGHSYVVYGPLSLGSTIVIYEGAIDYPEPDRLWKIIEKHGVTILYTAPTAIRMLMKYGEKWVKNHDLSTLRLLGTVGEPINPRAWKWYYSVVGDKNCPICDCYWQTETGGHVIYPPNGIQTVPLKPGSASFAGVGIEADIVDKDGKSVPPNTKGNLIIKKPWPGMLKGLWNDPERYKASYWNKIPGVFATSDYATKDDDGYIWILGRADEVLNVAGHRIGTAELEHELVSNPMVAESAVIGKPDEVKGEVPVAFVTLNPEYVGRPKEELKKELIQYIRDTMGPIAIPSIIFFVSKMPKTRSGKIMRRILKKLVVGEEIGDISTLEDTTSVDEIKQQLKGSKTFNK
ncbi:acetyl-CoA synthetase [Methanococcus voltae PS]|uniref:Acetate--CoA ligase n=1 Tax=Methanococcus voltae PS TaxID=523842 RepID=A0ABT2EWF2_METVO|nr:acetate--CoA ligase [Methanococcus voltae]MCS3922272.1 acetyl-CoA synthetase [Methanococcus voltae PS]